MHTPATSRRLQALLNHPAYKTPLGPNQGRGVASGYWFNGGGEFERDVAGECRRHCAGGDRQPGYRWLARVDGADGGGDAGRGLQPGAGDRRGHRLDRLHARHRRLARDVRDGDGGGERHQDGDQGSVPAGRGDLGRRSGGRDLGRRPRQAGRFQRRRVQAAVVEARSRRSRRRPVGRSPPRRR